VKRRLTVDITCLFGTEPKVTSFHKAIRTSCLLVLRIPTTTLEPALQRESPDSPTRGQGKAVSQAQLFAAG
jgi:hypothetical protein